MSTFEHKPGTGMIQIILKYHFIIYFIIFFLLFFHFNFNIFLINQSIDDFFNTFELNLIKISI